jgi:aspartyl-tRNA(Asn)/glutamyl-tRNA(Gln) amidotransferase subunit A
MVPAEDTIMQRSLWLGPGKRYERFHSTGTLSRVTELAFAEIAEIAPRLQRKEVSPVELTRACLEQIEALEPSINAFLTVLADSALGEAQRAEQEIAAGNYRGPLHGIPIAHKDVYYTAGIRTTAGSKILGDFVPEEDATAVKQLREAGTVLLGKLNMHEFAAGGTNVNPHYGATHNPWDLERIPGGSSGGSAAALATGMCLGATGSDTAGSIRIPSHCCGTTGIKPTYGRVSTYGVVPLSWSLDNAGPMARSARDCALLLRAMAGFDACDSASVDRSVPNFSEGIDGGVGGLRVGVPASYFNEPLEADVERAWRGAIEVLVQLGAAPVDVAFPNLGPSIDIGAIIVRSECTVVHRDWYAKRPDDYSQALKDRFAQGNSYSAIDYVAAQRIREQIRADFRAAFERADVLILPTMPFTAPRIDEEFPERGTRFTYPLNLAGLPSLTVPCGFDSRGLPTSVQIVAPHWQEALALRVGRAFQRETNWHKQRPGIRVAV